MTWKQAVEGNKQELERLLRMEGVYVDMLKSRKVKYTDAPGYYKISKRKDELEEIPTERIIGFSRSDAGTSFYDLLQGKGGNIALERIEYYLQKTELMSPDDKQRWFLSDDFIHHISAEHLMDTDEYIISSDGNHRSIVAVCLGIPKIRVRITEFECDYELKKRYDFQKELYEKYDIETIKCDANTRDDFSIIVYLKVDSDLRSVVIPTRRFKTNTYFESMEKLAKCIEHDLQKVRKLRKIPEPLRKVIYFFLPIRELEDYLTPIKEYDAFVGIREVEWNPYKYFQPQSE